MAKRALRTSCECGGVFIVTLLLVVWHIGVFGPSAWGQAYSGSLTGVVSDSSGAVIPGIKVTLTDEGKGYVFNATTDSVGRYILLALPPSTYKLSVEAQGFRAYVQSGITLDVDQNATVNVSLQIGHTTQEVEVTDTAPLLSTQDAVTGQGIDRTFINNLPLINRDVMVLAYLAPGVTSTGAGGPGNNFISNGGRNATADVLMDGVTANNYEQNGGIQVPTYIPSPEAVEEFKVQQNNFTAEFGFTGATEVNLITRSGTNQFHGAAYDFLRNNALDANNFFNNRDGIHLPGLHRNNFGATVGGPIRKDRTFFFFDYDGLRESSLSSNSGGVPSALERTGDFRELCANNGGTFDATGLCSSASGQLWDPYSGVFNPNEGGPDRSRFIPFNNLITYQSPGNPNLNGTGYQLAAKAGNLIDPVALKFMQYYPMPNVNVGASNYDPFNNWATSGIARSRNDQWDLKIDQRFSERNLLSAKYSQDKNSGHDLNCFGNLADPCTSGPSDGTAHVFAMNFTHTVSPNTLVVLTYGLTRGAAADHSIAGDFKNIDPVALLGMPSYMLRSGFKEFPAIGFSNYFGIGTQTFTVLGEGQETHQVAGTITHQIGRHGWKFGGEVRVHRINFDQPGWPAGGFNFDFTSTAQAPALGSQTGGDDFASFLTGIGNGGEYEVPNFVSTQNFQYGGFVNDDYRATPKLTITMGLRYDVTLPRTERYNRMNWIDSNVISPVQAPGLPQLHGGEMFTDANHRTNYRTDYKDFQPRIGLAYSLNSKTVLRAGYGIYYSVSKAGATGTGPIGGYQGYDQQTNWINTLNSDGSTPWGRLSDPFPGVGPLLPPGRSKGLLNDVGFGASGPLPQWTGTTPYEQTWSFGLQREVGWGVMLDAAYVGKKGTHLYYGSAGELDHLGAWVEKASSGQITALNTFVNNPFFGIITDPNSPLSAPQVQASQLTFQFPQFTSFQSLDPPWANSIYHAFQLRIEKRFSNGLQFLTTYTDSKAIDDSSVTADSNSWLGGSVRLQDPNNLKLERSLSQFDIPQILQFSYVYQLPVGHGKRFGSNLNRLAEAIVGGWQTNGVWRFSSGRPIAISLSGGGQPLPTYGAQKPNIVGTLRRNAGSDWLDHYFANPQVLVRPDPFTVSNVPRVLPNIRIPGQSNAELSLFKEFPLSRLREGMRLEYRVEASNALNHPQFRGPNTSAHFNSSGQFVQRGTFGVITSQANSPREVQMALKFYW